MVLRCTISLNKNIIIIIDINLKDYNLFKDFFQIKSADYCPACKSKNLKLHGNYKKYYYKDLITILRIKCLDCGITHAIIPSFSLPGKSIGTEEAEKYLKQRRKGYSVYAAGKLFQEKGFSTGYAYKFEQ